MIARINESPSLRKLFRNKLAVCAMVIVALYVLLFAWIIVMDSAAWLGKKTGTYDLGQRPILGALLTTRTLDRVGAANLPGFGIKSRPEIRTEQTYFHLEWVGATLTRIERLNPDEGLTARDIIAQQALAERTLADLPPERLREIHRRALDEFQSQSGLRILRAKLLAIHLAARHADDYLERYHDRTESDDTALILEEISLSLEEIAFHIEEVQPQLPEGSPLAEFDPAVFFDAAESILAEPMPDPLVDPELLAGVRSAVEERLHSIDRDIDAKLDQLDPLIAELMPMPTGVNGGLYQLRLMLGTDRQGRSILIRALYSAKVAIQVGIVVSFFAVGFGSLIGAAAGYFGGIVDHAVIWLYSTFSSIPDLVLLIVLAFMFRGMESIERTLIPLYIAFGLTYWIGPCRVTRGEALKLKQLDFVQAANAIGAGRGRILLRHILPNTAHLVFINLSLLFIAAIKGEVVLTYLGLGLKEGASWGLMVDQSRSEVIAGFFWQIGAATFFMFVLVLAFNVLTDALQDAFDPKHVG